MPLGTNIPMSQPLCHHWSGGLIQLILLNEILFIHGRCNWKYSQMAPTGEHIVETKIIWNKIVRARSHQYIWAESSVPSPKSFPNPSIGKGKSGDDLDGQFHSTVSHLESERDTIEMCQLSLELLIWCSQSRIHMRAQYITGEKNVMADAHEIQTTWWPLNPEVFKNLCNHWGTLNIDLFSSQLNHKLPVYVFPLSDPRAWAVHARSIPWEVQTITIKVITNNTMVAETTLVNLTPAVNQGVLFNFPGVQNYWNNQEPGREILHQNVQVLNLHTWLL